MKTLKLFSPIAIFLVLMLGCSPVKVVTDIKSETDFSKFETFKVVHFVPEEAQQSKNFRVNQMNRARIEAAIASNAELRGMKKVETDPDVVLFWATDVDIEKSYSSHTTYAGGGYWGYRGGYYMGGPAFTTTSENTYYVGKLTIGLVERTSEDLLWYGQGTKDISGDAGNAEATINLIVGKIMEKFPVGAAENN